MKINEAISKALVYKEGYEYGFEQMFGWLVTCEQMLWDQFISRYSDAQERPHYDPVADGNTELLVPDPYSELYIHYLAGQMCYLNRETTGYVNAKEQYEAMLHRYMALYMRNHSHLCNTTIKGAI